MDGLKQEQRQPAAGSVTDAECTRVKWDAPRQPCEGRGDPEVCRLTSLPLRGASRGRVRDACGKLGGGHLLATRTERPRQ